MSDSELFVERKEESNPAEAVLLCVSKTLPDIMFLVICTLLGADAEEASTQYVSPPLSDECKFTKEGTYYRGTISVAESGNTCRMWSSFSELTDANFGGDSVKKVIIYKCLLGSEKYVLFGV